MISISEKYAIEPLGSKEKFWVRVDNENYLFKIGRPNTGENWAEIVAYKLANYYNLPCAEYKFANFENKIGVLTKNIVPDGCVLQHGSTLFFKHLANQKNQRRNKKKYKLLTALNSIETLDKILSIHPNHINPHISDLSAFSVFIGFLLFDFLIGNQDRHEENWGLISCGEKIFLAPTFDHASSLGCRLSSEEMKKRLITKDNNYSVNYFASRAMTPFYSLKGLQLKSIDVVLFLKRTYIKQFKHWTKVFLSIDKFNLQELINFVNSDVMNDEAKLFVNSYINSNLNRLKEILQ